ncbi:MAG: cytochrome c3 family protein, partial [Anaerolineales bacterium]
MTEHTQWQLSPRLRRTVPWLLTLLTVLTLAAGAGLSALAAWEPYAPGEPLYPLQNWAAETRLLLMFDKRQLAERWLDRLELRLHDLDYRAGSPYELTALLEFDRTLNQAVGAIQSAPAEAQERLLIRLATLAARYQALLPRLTGVQTAYPELYAEAVRRAATLLRLTSDTTSTAANLSELGTTGLAETSPPAQATATATPVEIGAHPVPFPPNATAGPHDFFPLTGKHASVSCTACHANGTYKGTSRVCADCHGEDRPANHFTGTCSNCHSTTAWKPAQFDHSGLTDCASCHTGDKPANHYEGQCSACHTPAGWKPAVFNHNGQTDCLSCHTKDRPAQHYQGQCSLCHSQASWKGAIFNHAATGGADCATCHQPPAGHYAGACKDCHTDTTDWKKAVFNHATIGSADCSTCHGPPANHFAGACKDCHTDTGNWRNATFNHATIGGADCATCHQPPAGH